MNLELGRRVRETGNPRTMVHLLVSYLSALHYHHILYLYSYTPIDHPSTTASDVDVGVLATAVDATGNEKDNTIDDDISIFNDSGSAIRDILVPAVVGAMLLLQTIIVHTIF